MKAATIVNRRNSSNARNAKKHFQCGESVVLIYGNVITLTWGCCLAPCVNSNRSVLVSVVN